MLKAISSILLAAIGTAGSAQPQSQPQSPPAAGSGQHVVVVGDRDAYRRRLAECLARRCPPNEDIDATTALAEVLFDEGEYREARTVLRASIGRNRDEAARYPEPVSDLYRATARVTRQLGFDQEAQRSTWQILSALRAGLPVEDHRHFTARLEIVESLTAFGEYQQAQRELRELARAGPCRRARRDRRDDGVAQPLDQFRRGADRQQHGAAPDRAVRFGRSSPIDGRQDAAHPNLQRAGRPPARG